jgi:hypothetical protein
MQFMVMRRADEATEAAALPAPAVFDDMGRYHEELAAAGGVALAMGLRPSKHAVRLKMWPGGESITDGPFTETKELIAGFTIFEADSKEHAVELLKRWPASAPTPMPPVKPCSNCAKPAARAAAPTFRRRRKAKAGAT